MRKIIELKYGSHLYGTATKESDLDIKAVYLPSARDILLQQVRPVISESRPKKRGEKNSSDDVDVESYSLGKYLHLLAEGQTVALDMLFAPEQFHLTKPDELWERVKTLAPQILNKNAASFLGYCRQQAKKYGIKGERMADASKALEVIQGAEEQFGLMAPLSSVHDDLKRLAHSCGHISIGKIPQPGDRIADYVEICGKKALLDASIKSAKAIAQKIVNEYGARARAADEHDGVDWKALYHAVRIGYEAKEFLNTHKITFPRPEAAHLLKIRRGKVPYEQVGLEIEQLLEEVEEAAQSSTLPSGFDQKLIDDFVEEIYRGIITMEVR